MSGRQASRRLSVSATLKLRQHVDLPLLLAVACLLGLGLVMVASASVSIADRATGDALYYFKRQLLFAGLGIAAAACVYAIRLSYWQRLSTPLFIFSAVLLVLVLVPGVGKTVNGSSRWLALGMINLQVSELAKLATLLYLAGYLVRRGKEVRQSVIGFLKPLLLVAVIAALLLLEPDFGAMVVLITAALGMLFLGGVRLAHFSMLLALAVTVIGALALSSPYRLERITTFLNPWADPFDSGFQLTQSLIAIGSGGWFGRGLGGSVQKLFYLPEAHTDFLFAVLAEELGLLAVALVIVLFSLLVWRCFVIGRDAERQHRGFGTYLAYGIGLWIGVQAFVNMGVSMGALPTKGLTLPLMSMGGSSMLVVGIAIALVLRVYREGAEAAMPTTTPSHTIRVVPT